MLDQLKEDVNKLKKQNEKKEILPQSTIEETSFDFASLINPVVENFEFHVIHTIKCTQ